MKFVLLVAICVFGTVLCDTHQQQQDYAEVLVDTLGYQIEDIEELLRNTDATSDKGAKAILIHANSFNFDLHSVVNGLQHLVSESKEESALLQETVSKFNSIANELEKSFRSSAVIVKFQLKRSLNNVVKEAKMFEQIIRESQNHLYRADVLRFLDDLVTGVQKLFFRSTVRAAPIKIILKTYVHLARTAINMYLSLLNSENRNVQNDIVQYSSKFSSALSRSVNLLKDLVFTYATHKEEDVKEIVYSLGQICYENEEVLYNQTSFKKIEEQFRTTTVNVSNQLSKMIDAGFSDSGIFLKDENLIYVVFPEMYAQWFMLIRNLEKTMDNSYH